MQCNVHDVVFLFALHLVWDFVCAPMTAFAYKVYFFTSGNTKKKQTDINNWNSWLFHDIWLQ